jgi:hypothetical protein
MTSTEERERCYSFVLSRTPHETVFCNESAIFSYYFPGCSFNAHILDNSAGLNKLHFSLSIGGILLLILATQETRCVGKSGGISRVKINTLQLTTFLKAFIGKV